MAARKKSESQLLAELRQDQLHLRSEGHLNGTKEASRQRLEVACSKGLDLTGLEDLQELHKQVDAPPPEPEPATDEPEPAPSTNDEFEELVALAKAKNSKLSERAIKQLVGMPGDLRFVPTGNRGGNTKAPFDTNWDRPNAKSYTARELVQQTAWPDAIGAGILTGPQGLGIFVIDWDVNEDIPDATARAFLDTTGRPTNEIPKTATLISGKPDRKKMLFRVPMERWSELGNYCYSPKAKNSKGNEVAVLEFLWLQKEGKCRHAAMCGDHIARTEENDWHFRWADGLTPAEVGITELPGWVIDGFVKKTREKEANSKTSDNSDDGGDAKPTPWEKLKSGRRLQLLVEEWLPFAPPRLEEGSGTYENARNLLSGLIHEFHNDVAVIHHVLETSGWIKLCDPNFNVLDLIESLISNPPKGDPCTIGTVIYLCTKVGNDKGKGEWPKWALSNEEQSVLADKSESGQLAELCSMANTCDDSNTMAIHLRNAYREFGLTEMAFMDLRIKNYFAAYGEAKVRSGSEVLQRVREDNNTTDVIEGVLQRNVGLLVGASNSGKTSLCAMITNRVLGGHPMDIGDIRHATQKGKVLWFTGDGSDTSLVDGLELEFVDMEDKNLRIIDDTTFNDPIKIAKILEREKPDLVFYDSLATMKLNNVKIGDPDFAKPIEFLVKYNGRAWPQCAHRILWHTSRDEAARFSGSEQIKARAEEMVLYYPPELLEAKKRGEAKKPHVQGPTRHYFVEKSRNGYQGQTLSITRNATKGSWQFRLQGESLSALEELRQKFRSDNSGDKWRTTQGWIDHLQLKFSRQTLGNHFKVMVRQGFLEQKDNAVRAKNGKQSTGFRMGESQRLMAAEMVKGVVRNGHNNLDGTNSKESWSAAAHGSQIPAPWKPA